jgi:hypothetical protein
MVRRMPFGDSLTIFSGLALGPGGAEVALAWSTAAATRIFVMGLTDGELHHVADVAAIPGVHLVLQRWATDGNLYFSRVVGVATPELWRLPARGGALQRFATLPVGCSQGTISLSADAQNGACLVYDDRPDLWLVERR